MVEVSPKLKVVRAADGRRRRLARLLRDLQRIRETLKWVQGETSRLGAVEAGRRLTAEEATEVARIRRQSEALLLELGALRAEFEELHAEHRGGIVIPGR